MLQFHVCPLLLLPASSWRSPRTQSHGPCQSQYPATKHTTSEQNTTRRVNSKMPHIQTKKKLLQGHKQQSQFSSITMTLRRSSSRHGPVSKDYGPLLLWPWKNVKVTKINIQCRTQWRLSPCRVWKERHSHLSSATSHKGSHESNIPALRDSAGDFLRFHVSWLKHRLCFTRKTGLIYCQLHCLKIIFTIITSGQSVNQSFVKWPTHHYLPVMNQLTKYHHCFHKPVPAWSSSSMSTKLGNISNTSPTPHLTCSSFFFFHQK